MKNLIDKSKLIINHNIDYFVYFWSKGIFIIDFVLTIASLKLLIFWKILVRYLSILDHKLILLQWEDLKQDQDYPDLATNTEYNI